MDTPTAIVIIGGQRGSNNEYVVVNFKTKFIVPAANNMIPMGNDNSLITNLLAWFLAGLSRSLYSVRTHI